MEQDMAVASKLTGLTLDQVLPECHIVEFRKLISRDPLFEASTSFPYWVYASNMELSGGELHTQSQFNCKTIFIQLELGPALSE